MARAQTAQREQTQAAAPQASTGNLPAAAVGKSVLYDMADRYGMEPAAFEQTLRKTVVPGSCSREQFAAFLLVAKEYNLNPLTKEIYAFPTKGGGIQPIVGIDGWSNLINSHPAFDGMEFDDATGDGGALISITCRMFRKDRKHATSATEYMAECKRPTEPWQKWPRRMLRHKAMIQAARYAFGYAGINDPDEAERIAAEAARDVTPRRVLSTAKAFDEFAGPAIDHDPATGEVIDQDFGSNAGSDADFGGFADDAEAAEVLAQEARQREEAAKAAEAKRIEAEKAEVTEKAAAAEKTRQAEEARKKADAAKAAEAAKAAKPDPISSGPDSGGKVIDQQGNTLDDGAGRSDPGVDTQDRRWPNGQVPSDADEYESYAETKIADFAAAADVAPWWKSKEEIQLRKNCNVPEDMFKRLLAKAQGRVAELSKK